ncbi:MULTISPECIES: HNH endonuclease signature motif containing protein [unclassified Streptomyces]|uniref:HNH endonuclease signature motif containing protein n=1 Tax=unclassified Streptomyces TaxID=2593676 RepID=UPI00136BA933|nr:MULTISPECIES: HNH endonuclease signature motif containing protein [unclassified Streptomyces]NEA00454.1 HNH endonuclease [Streptomyces sp. SID10116]MYY81081.1 HNH endonuclease [Streptomyces sp. SID335]MYZ19312.1 HNH endonuclease [Streptomyces sp. SID337]NDZ87901.1 HNH endonuclease [Streptomyces sp. SID10115]NEB48355.1 HNH endonuclease [Streptomyces sp. SID339]
MPVSPYTKERLEEAARSSRTLSEALEKLGVDPKSSTRRYIHGRMKKLGVVTSHFEREGTRWTRSVLEPAVAASKSVNDVLRYLGIEVVGGHHTNISRRIKAYGIDTSHVQQPSRLGIPRQRCTPELLLVEQEPTRARRIQGDRLRQAMTDLGTAERCAMCGTEPLWRGRPLPLEVDHIDGNWRDNRIENLRLLCPNCHSATDTYRGRGKTRRA